MSGTSLGAREGNDMVGRQRKTPMRRCIGCGARRPKEEMMRIVRSPEGKLTVDTSGRKPGRGAYVCRSRDCVSKALAGEVLSRALRVSVGEKERARLRKQLLNITKDTED